jgi:predicted nucleic acid-binding protein
MQVLPIVLDTNIALDLLLYQDPAVAALRKALSNGDMRAIATAAMHAELTRVLDYPHIAQRRVKDNLNPEIILKQWLNWTQLVPAAPRCQVICKDPDDQMFIDLAVQHACPLLSKDHEVLKLQKRLSLLGVNVSREWLGP